MPVEMIVEDARWNEAGLEALASRAAQATLAHLGLDPELWEISLLACDDSRIMALNADFRDKPAATNVLSWPAEDRAPEAPGARPAPPEPDVEPFLGDVAIAWETCAREAAEAGRPLADHVTHLVVHAVLHLLGYDHIRDPDATLMETTEITILGKLGVPDPYT
ncbi:rRNA maturation RNase YbeY [Roseovarius nitratireducens]|uniref:rRNA maturation RNase YbeY n=1 Tax=Roseovarius nitratireducens TaxID=2044597 RepID=UPI000CE238CB|nr:rRNA maturation RNase YbeY [Roseovarius nitratireducens]